MQLFHFFKVLHAYTFSEHFMPYIEECYQEALKLPSYGSYEVTKSSLKALANFAIAVHDYNRKMNDETSSAGTFLLHLVCMLLRGQL